MGVYGNGRYFENLIQKLNCNNLTELQEIGKQSFVELSKVIPSFIRRSEPSHKYQKAYDEFQEHVNSELGTLADQHSSSLKKMEGPGVRLMDYDPESVFKVAASLLFPYTNSGLMELEEYCRKLTPEELGRILETAAAYRENRRHKSPRALEQAVFTFEIVADFGIYRDLQRHRILTQDRQLLTCDLGYYIPTEIADTDMEKDYRVAMDSAKEAYETIRSELPEEAQYTVPMAFNIHWYFKVNLRALQWICELRSSPAGHPSYRFIAQEMAQQIVKVNPEYERFLRFVDYEGYELGRLGQEIRIIEKKQSLPS